MRIYSGLLVILLWGGLLTACGSAAGDSQTQGASEGSVAESADTDVDDNSVCEDDRLWGNWNFSGALAQFPGCYPVDEPEILRDYFEDICQRGAQIWVRNGEADSLYIWHTIDELDRYAGGLRPSYPSREVERSLAMMHDRIEMVGEDLGDLDSDKVYPGEAFFFRFLEQAARFCPEVNYLTDCQTENQVAGIYCHSFSATPPFYSFLIYRSTKGFKVQLIGQKAFTWIDKIYQLEDAKGRIYYLCSNQMSRLSFCQYLYRIEEGNLLPVCSTLHFTESDLPDDAAIVFNQDKKCWTYCQWDDGTEQYRQIPDTRTLRLYLNGDQSFFRLDK